MPHNDTGYGVDIGTRAGTPRIKPESIGGRDYKTRKTRSTGQSPIGGSLTDPYALTRAAGSEADVFTPAAAPPPTGAATYGTPAQGTGQALTGFGRSIAPGAYGEAWANPEALIQQWFNYRNLPEHGGGYAMAQDEAERMGILWLLLNNENTLAQGTAGYTDFSGDYLANQFLPGGRGVSPADVASAMFGAQEGSPVYDSLAAANLSPSQQVQNFLSTMAAAMGGSIPAPVLRSALAGYQKSGDEFTAQRLTPEGATGSMSFMDYLTQQGKGASRFGG